MPLEERIGANPQLERLRRQLVSLDLLTSEEWDAAYQAAAAPADARPVLEQLAKTPANWGLDEDRCSILTPFQVEHILAGHADELRLQHYVILDILGSGGMGQVFKARNLNLPRLEAIKTVRLADKGATEGARSQIHQRFEREKRLLTQLNHPHIPTIFHADLAQGQGLAYIAMEYIRGDDLESRVEKAKARGEAIPVGWAVEKIITVAEVLQHAHQKGVIHRDIKPANILLTPTDSVRVLDLGIARLVSPENAGAGGANQRLTSNITRMGTPDVMPPEQWLDAGDVDAATDIYSLGCTLFYVLAGRMPFEKEDVNDLMFAHLHEAPPAINKLRPDVPSGLAAVLAKMLAKDRAKRYSSAAAAIDALRPFASAETSAAATVAASPAPTRSIALIVIAIAVVAALLLTAAWAYRSWRGAPAASGRSAWLRPVIALQSD